MTRWEYLARGNCSADELNELGADGWELVSAAYNSDRSGFAFYFKRPKEA
ncbi:DUF4177 domain-containing protein [Streptosporangium sp. NBC_01755]|nr:MULTISPECIES: hypothetical protein [unclassified Streptosporangium]WSA27390.1 DUF4177 domain-containing protein [Streptosporangium sp. NBC_01810]WSD03215.1 DUF4177 domain-containing protein [Streptosporangium sp. NBC_01755]